MWYVLDFNLQWGNLVETLAKNWLFRIGGTPDIQGPRILKQENDIMWTFPANFRLSYTLSMILLSNFPMARPAHESYFCWTVQKLLLAQDTFNGLATQHQFPHERLWYFSLGTRDKCDYQENKWPRFSHTWVWNIVPVVIVHTVQVHTHPIIHNICTCKTEGLRPKILQVHELKQDFPYSHNCCFISKLLKYKYYYNM
jgi:hypothetical protein